MVLLASIAALYVARDILIALAFALTLTFLTPVVALLQRLRIGRVAVEQTPQIILLTPVEPSAISYGPSTS